MGSLRGNFILLAGGSIGSQLLSAIAMWVFARYTDPSQLGFALSGMGIATLLLTTLDFGINSLTIRTLARRPDETDVFTQTLSAKIFLSILMGATWCIFIAGIASTTNSWWPLTLLGLYIVLSDTTQSVNVLARSGQRMSIVALTSVLDKAAMLAMTAVFFFCNQLTVTTYLIALTTGALVGLFTAWRFVPTGLRRIDPPTLAKIRRLLQDSKGFGLSSFASQLQKADVTIVAVVAGNIAAGIFAAPARFTNFLGFVPLALSGALYPKVSASTARNDVRREVLRLVTWMELGLAIPYVILFLGAETIINLVLGQDYADSVPVLRIILIGMVFASANSPLSTLIQAEGREVAVARYVGVGSIIGLSTIALGAFIAQAEGAAFGFLAMQMFITATFTTDLITTSHLSPGSANTGDTL